MSVGKGLITYGDHEITYELCLMDRKTIEIAVYPDARVVVKAPRNASHQEVCERVIKRARWIRRQLEYFSQYEPRTPQRQYIGGETHRYLGRQYRLKIVEGSENCVKLTRGYFVVTCLNRSDASEVRSLLWSWYASRAQHKFSESFSRCWPMFERKGFRRPKLKIRQMKTRWGSLSSRGSLTLNLLLIMAPNECIDYVVTHELCHLKHPNHSADFYELLGKVMPDWNERKQKLEHSAIS